MVRSYQRLFEFLYKETLTADVRERRRRHLVAAGANLDDFNFDSRNLRSQTVANDCRLRERQLAGTRTDFDLEGHGGT